LKYNCIGRAQLSKNYDNCKIMSETYPYYFHWTLTPTHIDIAVQAPANRGWIGLGFPKVGTTQNFMISDGEGTDAIISYLQEDDPNCPEGCVRDYWIAVRSNPPRDAIQNAEFVAASRDGSTGLVTFEFRRLLTTNDTSFDRVIDPDVERHVNWAFNNDTNAVANNGTTLRFHGDRRGTVVMVLSEPSTCTTTPVAQTAGSFTNSDGTYYAEWATQSDEITVTFRGKTRTGWVGFAFDADGMMPDHDSYVGWVDTSGTATLTDRHTSVRAMPLTDVESGGSDDILSFEGSVVTIDGAEWLQFTFRRKLDTGDQFDVIVAPGAPGNLLWAIGPDNGVDYTAGTFQFHKSKGSYAVDFFGGCATSSIDLRRVHGILMILAWCALLFCGSFFARYLKVLTTAWFKIHVALQTVGVAVVLAAFIIIFVSRGGVFTMGAHQVIGTIIFALTMAQPFIGLIADRLFDPSRSKVPAQDQIHWWVGRLLLVLAIVNIFLGIDRLFINSTGAYIMYGLFAGWTGLTVAILIANEVRVGGAQESDVINLDGGNAKLISSEENKKKKKAARSTFLAWIILQVAILVAFLVIVGISNTDGNAGFVSSTSTC
jgi:uncharacterized membrane protein YhaH (DUF805 family)